MKLTKASLVRVLKIVLLSLPIGVVIGYFSFYVTMPSVVVPSTINPDLPTVGVLVFAVGFLVGLLSEDLESVTIEILLGTVMGPIIGWLLFISPSFIPGVILPDPSGYLYNVLHSALPLLIISLVLLFISGFASTSVMENLMTKATPSPFAEAEMALKAPPRDERKQ